MSMNVGLLDFGFRRALDLSHIRATNHGVDKIVPNIERLIRGRGRTHLPIRTSSVWEDDRRRSEDAERVLAMLVVLTDACPEGLVIEVALELGHVQTSVSGDFV